MKEKANLISNICQHILLIACSALTIFNKTQIKALTIDNNQFNGVWSVVGISCGARVNTIIFLLYQAKC